MTERIRQNWFWPCAAGLIALALFLSRQYPASIPENWENAVLFDMLVTMPVLYLLCYRRQLTRKAMLIRLLALQCLGIWLATKIVPINSQNLLPSLSWFRNIGLVVLVLVELRLMVAIFKAVFKSDASAVQLEEKGLPPLIAKLILLEARFWKRVFGIFRKDK